MGDYNIKHAEMVYHAHAIDVIFFIYAETYNVIAFYGWKVRFSILKAVEQILSNVAGCCEHLLLYCISYNLRCVMFDHVSKS